ncbi:MAG: hypothetical protein Q9195_006167 [Heterodermia aff. obscurata]
MEVAVSINDSRGLSPAHQRQSRYSTPDASNIRSPNSLEPTSTFPIVSSQEPGNIHNNSSIHTHQQEANDQPLAETMEADGQDHDRMDTDNASETSGSEGDPTPPDDTPAGVGSVHVPSITDVEAMDTTPDTPDVRLPFNPQFEGQEDNNNQDVAEDTPVNHNLVRTNSRGSTVASRSPTNTPPPSNPPETFISVIIDPSTGQRADTVLAAQAAEDWPTLFPPQTQPNPAPEPPETHAPAEHEGDRNGNQEEDSPDEESVDEEEQPYWANFIEDKTVPSEEETKLIEQDTEERSALDHAHWESLAFEPLDDPEYVPTATGRIEWTLKGFHGTPEAPNKEVVMRSPSIAIGGYYWNIKVYPRGNENTDSMSVYVECSASPRDLGNKEADRTAADLGPSEDNAGSQGVQNGESRGSSENAAHSTDSSDARDKDNQPMESEDVNETSRNEAMDGVVENEQSWEVPAQVLCIAYNPEEPRVHAYQKVTHRYHKDTADWGWTRFHGPWDRLHRRERLQRQAMLRHDTLCFTAYIRTVKDDTRALWWHSPANRPEWDSFERLGLNRLWVGSPESSAVLSAVSTWLHIYPLCSSITNPMVSFKSGTWNIRDRPFHQELDHIRGQFTSALKESEESISLMNVAEMLDWNDAGDCEPDVVSNLDVLRRTLSYEALDVRKVADVKDIFEDILLLRQPDLAPDPFDQAAPQNTARRQNDSKEHSSVQQAVAAASSCLQIDALLKQPAVLQVELQRQRFDKDLRKWNKLTHRISIDESIVFQAHTGPSTAYTLFGAVIHSGDLESKDYYSVIRPHGPGTRWIKYAGDKASRGVECLTTKQALEAHEGSDTAGKTAAVAYLVTYVRTDLLSSLPVESTFSRFTANRRSESLSEIPKTLECDVKVPVYVYQSGVFNGYQGLGVADWKLRESDCTTILKLEVPDSIFLDVLVGAIDSAWKATKPDATGKYALWFMDTVKGNLAMENVVRAPEMIALSIRGPDTRLKDAHTFYGVCRIWLDDNLPIQPEVVPEPPTSPINAALDAPPPSTPPLPEDTMQVDEDGAENGLNPAAASPEQPSEAAPIEVQIPQIDDQDTVMEGNADPDAAHGSAQVGVPHVWNSNFDTKVLGCFDNVFVFLKSFDADSQTLAGVKTFWVKQNDRVGYTIRQAMSWDDDVAIDIYQEQTLSTIELVRSGSTFRDISGTSNYILVVQKRPSSKDVARLTAAGKPANIPNFFSYQCSACDPAYLKPYLTRSYFASPYFSGSIAHGRPHGQGTLITTIGDAYTGNFVSGLKSGHGNMRFANGDTYKGSWANDDPDGQGEMVYAKTGNVYTGGFRKRKRHGKGIMKFEVADEEEHLCGICYEEEMDCCFYDCGHVAACEGCARQVDVCPVCRRGVKAVVRIWRS